VQSHLHPCTAHGDDGTSLEKPAMLTSSETAATAHSRRRRIEAAVTPAHLHHARRWWHQLREASDARVESEHGDGTQPTSKDRGCSQTCTPAPQTAVVAPQLREASDARVGSEHAATAHSRRRRTEAAVRLAPLHRADRGGSTSVEKPATLASSEHGDGTQPTSKDRGCAVTPAPLHRARR
jgi:hypothetical protein